MLRDTPAVTKLPGSSQPESEAGQMNSLRFLLVNTDARKTESISTVLASANHTVLPTTGLDEASEALYVERFDAVLLGSRFSAPSLGEFTNKLRQVEESQRGQQDSSSGD